MLKARGDEPFPKEWSEVTALETLMLCVYMDNFSALTKENTLTKVTEFKTWSKSACQVAVHEYFIITDSNFQRKLSAKNLLPNHSGVDSPLVK